MSAPDIAACARCGAAFDADQRYCLECGSRNGEPRVAFLELLAPPAQTSAPPPEEPRRDAISPGLAAAGVGLAVLFLGVGVLVGKAGSDDGNQAAAKPTVVRVAGGAPSGTTATDATASASTFKNDWPAGATGWTVQLQTLPKDGSDAAKVAAAKGAASAKGAPGVGALDSDDFESLDGGVYVVYSGRFHSQDEAKAALDKLRKDFPTAKVVRVGAAAAAGERAKAKQNEQQVQQLQSSSGSDYAKKSRKLPDKLALPGKPPPKDNKEGGGGSGFQTIN